jgi:amino acid transporter
VAENLSSLSMIMFAMAGVEVVATFANRVERPKRDLYMGLLLGSLCIFLFYVLGTFTMNILATPDEIRQTSGVMQAFAIVSQKFGLSWFTKTMASCLSFAELAALVVWLLAPVIMFFKCTPPGVLPAWMHKEDKRGTPVNAIVFQGVLVSFMILVTSALPSVNAMYQVLVLMATILYFIPYLFLGVVYWRALPELNVTRWMGRLFSFGIIISILLGIAVSFFPSSDLQTTSDLVYYESELIGGPLLFILIGWLLYRFRRPI